MRVKTFLIVVLYLFLDWNLSAQDNGCVGIGLSGNLNQYIGAPMFGINIEALVFPHLSGHVFVVTGVGLERLEGEVKPEYYPVLEYMHSHGFRDLTSMNQKHTFYEKTYLLPIEFGYRRSISADDSSIVNFFFGPVLAIRGKSGCESYLGGYSIEQDFLTGSVNFGELTDSFIMDYITEMNQNTPQRRIEPRLSAGVEIVMSKMHGISFEYQRGFSNKGITSDRSYSNIIKFGYRFHFLGKKEYVSRDF